MKTYLQHFFPCLENRHVYPYRVVYPMMLEHVDFVPITILYGNNGSGKSTLLNVLARHLGLKKMTLGNDNEYFEGYVKKCSSSIDDEGLPEDSSFIRSEDIMVKIARQRKLSIPNAKIYDLDARPSMERAWYELENMKAYYQLFKQYEDRF